MSVLKDDYGYEYPRINSHQFRTVFLPLLLDNDDPVGRQRWIDEVAIAPTNKVIVVDDEDYDKELFWVPPVIYSPETLEGTNMGQLIENAVVQAVTRHNVRILDSQINEFKSVMDPADPPQEDIDQWEYILKFYGLLKDDGTSKGDQGDSDNSTIEYEESEW